VGHYLLPKILNFCYATQAVFEKVLQPSVHDGTDLFHFCDVNDDGDKA